MTKRMNPIVDFVFKRIFGTEENKDLLLSFLNATLKPEEGKELKESSWLIRTSTPIRSETRLPSSM
ncbi:hypothetical protein BAG01nite_23720 [Brevibacillus agri]|uniref:Rpn family recombination-promoting nuclease/putative transposase n=1 Tax=Brevibacillus agri TaxID=51101 RepID=A0A3M8B8D6_9BACL|nr:MULTISPECIES: PD-(D/E)XK nuclease family transposase [Brevibacillus]EJL41447.1 hypothetical protein PMI08_03727 [Brevibacillus sp. CF112]MBY0050809.1 PD-(D/E)XK nuclease family transposase [Brevibacillus agri]MDN4091740.1 PD-(D/E)XK nuclease family transposase [Brevibacillus agri]MDR9506612.1 PD-(D/E)XK nuclease family transposase [Brevibacillus agri]MED3500745.1 PD-(D/E)XK nuclease family transposase [Brevibacillus agri]